MRTSIRLFAPLLLGSLPATGATPQPGPSPPAVTPRPANAADVARWNDRTTPRKMLETFYFAISGYDRVARPDRQRDRLPRPRAASTPRCASATRRLLAHQLEFILNRQGIAAVRRPRPPRRATACVLDEVGGQPIALARQTDGRWRFDADDRRPDRAAEEARRRAASARPRRPGPGWPRAGPTRTTTIRTFAARRDGPARLRDWPRGCLDLRDVPPKLRASEGAEMARKLAFVMQRCGFLFSQEIPNDPDGYRYVWHSNHRGRIMLERVRLPEGQDAWLFSRGTPAQPRRPGRGLPPQAARPALRHCIGVVIGEDVLAAGREARVPPPAGVPAGPRLAAEGAADVPGGDGRPGVRRRRGRRGPAGLPRPQLARPRTTARSSGSRLAAKLEAVLRRLRVDLMTRRRHLGGRPAGPRPRHRVAGHPGPGQATAPGGSTARPSRACPTCSSGSRPRRSRPASGARTSTRRSRPCGRSCTPSDAGDLDLAARCLDLDGMPGGARDELGPLLAYKLKFVLDRIGRVALEEIPAEADGPRYYYHRGPLGRIDLVRRDGEPRRGDWQFSRETVARIEAHVPRRVDRPIAPGLGAGQGRPRRPVVATGPLALAPLPPPRLAAAARRRGSTSTSGSAWSSPWRPPRPPPGWGSGSSERLACRLLRRGGFELDRALVASQAAAAGVPARPVVPVPAAPAARPARRRSSGVTIPAVKVVWIGLMGWTAFRLIDLGMVLYARSERLHDRRSLSDMIVPTAANGLKLAAFLVGRLVAGLPDRQRRDAHPAPRRPRPGRPGRVARGAGHAQELLRHAAADRRAPVPDRRPRRGPGAWRGPSRASASARPGCGPSRTRC